MPWFRIDDSFPTHPKTLSIPRRDRVATVGLWTLAGGWCAGQLTDGLLSEHMVEELAGTRKLAEHLVQVGLWEKADGAFQFHDWADYNPTREQVLAERAAWRQRQRRARKKDRPDEAEGDPDVA